MHDKIRKKLEGRNEGLSVKNVMNSVHPKVTLTKNMELQSGAHVLYMYSDQEKYIENVISFLASGIELKHGVVLIESPAMIELLKKRLLQKGFLQEEVETILCADHQAFYGTHQTFDIPSVLKTFSNTVGEFISNDIPVRIWSKVCWGKGTCFLEKTLPLYEQMADDIIDSMKVFTICCYNGQEIAADTAIGLMKGHSFVMTDEELAPSIYFQQHNQAPSLFVEKRLEEKVSHYKHLIEELPDAVFVMSGFEFIYANRMAAQLFECEVDELIGKPVWDRFPSQYHPVIKERYHKLQQGEKVSLKEMKVETCKRNMVDVEMISFPFVFGDSRKFTTISIIRSIEERKEHQQLTIKTEKLSIAGQLAASIAHEVRNPLTSIKGFIKLAKEDSMVEEYYQIIEEEIDRIDTIASELLVLGKPVSVEVVLCDAGKMLRDVCLLLQSQAIMKNIDIQYSKVQKNCPIRCNPGQMKQVFINIIKNAIEAMGEGGVIRAEASLHGGLIVIVIEDSGKGMPESTLKKLGEPFYSTKEDGTGLGLMVCFNIVEQYGGTIHVQSKVGTGTTFTLSLPAAQE